MLQITIPEREYFDEETCEFVYTDRVTLQLEHSLLSISKWEAKWHKAFLGKQPKSDEEMVDYVRCMTLNKNVDPKVYNRLTSENIEEINAYIENPMSSTYFPKDRQDKAGGDTPTAELIYYWMIASGIPFECQKWHLNRLLALIRVCGIKNAPSKKMSKSDILRRNASLNKARRNRHRK